MNRRRAQLEGLGACPKTKGSTLLYVRHLEAIIIRCKVLGRYSSLYCVTVAQQTSINLQRMHKNSQLDVVVVSP